jgi:hypothetical protein
MQRMVAFGTRVVRGDATVEQAKDSGMALVLILLVVWLLGARHNAYIVAAFGAHVVNMIAPQMFRQIAVIWFGVSFLLGATASRVILTAVFFAVVTPVGLTRRILGADPMRMRAFKASRKSVMIQREHTYVGKDLEQPY